MSTATADLEAELSCGVCLSIYREPVVLPCGHNFCRSCLGKAWDNQDPGRDLLCPECRAVFKKTLVPQRNIKLANIVERFRATRDQPRPLELERGEELSGDRKRPDTLEEISLTVQRCPNHEEPWEYFCRQHKICLCQYCWESHKDHSWQTLERAVEDGRATLMEEMERLERARDLLHDTVGRLQDAQTQLQMDRGKLKEQVCTLFNSIQETIVAEKRSILNFIEAEENLQHSRLEVRIGEIQRKKEASQQILEEVQELGNREMPNWEFVTSFQSTLEKLLKADVHIQSVSVHKREMDRALINQMGKEGQVLVKRLSKMIHDKLVQGQDLLLKHSVPTRTQAQKSKAKVMQAPAGLQRAPLTLDPNTAHCNLNVSEDLLSAEWVDQRRTYPTHPERFRLHPQVLCAQGFISGQHFWEVTLAGTRRWEVGVTCKGRDPSWVDSCIAWALRWDGRKMEAFEGPTRHPSPELTSLQQVPSRMRVCLDCEKGTLSFHAVREESVNVKGTGTRLHTFHIKPRGPVFPGFYLEQSTVRIQPNTS